MLTRIVDITTNQLSFKYFENATTCSIEYIYVDVFVRENIYLDIYKVQTRYLKVTLYRTKRIHFFINFSSVQPATVLGDPDFSITVHDFGKMQNTSPTGLLGEESNIDVF